MKTRTKKIICWITFMIAYLMIILPANYVNDWQFWCAAFGTLGIYFVGKYEGQNGF